MREKPMMTNEEILTMESDKISHEKKVKDVHHLLAIMSGEFEDIRKVYLTARGGDESTEDYMTQYMDQFESLLDIAIDTTDIGDNPTIK